MFHLDYRTEIFGVRETHAFFRKKELNPAIRVFFQLEKKGGQTDFSEEFRVAV
jgi:hypothetical protein